MLVHDLIVILHISVKFIHITVTIFWDGYETSHIALMLTLYELARNQRVQQKLRQEILDAGEMTFDVLNNLPYLDQCIHGKKLATNEVTLSILETQSHPFWYQK